MKQQDHEKINELFEKIDAASKALNQIPKIDDRTLERSCALSLNTSLEKSIALLSSIKFESIELKLAKKLADQAVSLGHCAMDVTRSARYYLGINKDALNLFLQAVNQSIEQIPDDGIEESKRLLLACQEKLAGTSKKYWDLSEIPTNLLAQYNNAPSNSHHAPDDDDSSRSSSSFLENGNTQPHEKEGSLSKLFNTVHKNANVIAFSLIAAAFAITSLGFALAGGVVTLPFVLSGAIALLAVGMGVLNYLSHSQQKDVFIKEATEKLNGESCALYRAGGAFEL